MNKIGRFYLFHLLLLLFVQVKSGWALCNMPSAWHGLWYQRGMNSLLEISNDHFQTKGHCHDALVNEQYYLFTDRINRCIRCLLFIDRHRNLLQYRESECTDADELSSINLCPNMIAPDAPLYTLYRNNSELQSCPIQAPLLLTKLSKDGSTCTPSSSYIGECANDYHFRLHLSSCSSSSSSSSTHQILDLQLACIGTWIEGFHTYFVTRILSEHHHHHRYACFYFLTKQKDFSFSSTFALSMVTDDSCRYLNSKQMATVMTLSSPNRPIDHQFNHSCTFPKDFQQHLWYSLNQTIRMFINNHNIELFNTENHDDKQRFHCLQSIDAFNYRIRTFRNCDVKDECLHLHRPRHNVLELITYNCHDNQSNRTMIFLSMENSSTSCSMSIGHFLVHSNIHHQHRMLFSPKKTFQLSIGCDTKDQLLIYEQEKDSEDRLLIQTDQCLASWKSKHSSNIHIIAQSKFFNHSYCLSFQMGESIVIRNNSQDCSFESNIDSTSISIYSAKLLHPCSQSNQLLVNSMIIVWIILVLLNHHTR